MRILFALILLFIAATANAAEIYAIYISLTIPLQEPSNWTLTIDPTFAIYTSWLDYRTHAAMALPHLIVRAEEMATDMEPDWYEDIMIEEFIHTRQWDFFGPFFPLIYIIDRQTFEPYDVNGKNNSNYDHRRMWAPPNDDRRCPMMRLQQRAFSFMPCYIF